jgi:hypothetical protein
MHKMTKFGFAIVVLVSAVAEPIFAQDGSHFPTAVHIRTLNRSGFAGGSNS